MSNINIVRVPADIDDLRVLILSDLHVGHICFDESIFDYYLSLLDDDPDMRVVCLGDLHETKLRTSKGAPSEQIMPLPEQRKYLIRRLKPYSDRIDGVIRGNHEDRSPNDGGDDPMDILCDCLGISDRYFGNLGCVAYASDKPRKIAYRVSIKHGSGGGTTIGNPLNHVHKDIFNMNADIYLRGHYHKATFAGPFSRYDPDLRNASNPMREYWLATNGALLSSEGSYAEKRNYPLTYPAQLIMTLSMRKGHRSVEFATK